MSSLVNLGVWTADRRDSVRRKRLAMGYAMGVLVSAGLAAAVIANSKALAAEREEEILDVQLATTPEPEPQIEPEPARVENKPKPRPRIQIPLAVPTEAPQEADPVSAAKAAPDEDPFGQQEEKAPPPKAVAPVIAVVQKAAPRLLPSKPRGPIQITEDVTPPVPIATVAPSYPSAAKANGIEGTVVVKYVVTETGAVTNVQIVRGPAELREAVMTAMRTWRFRPAVFDGRPVAVSRVHRFPFHIKT